MIQETLKTMKAKELRTVIEQAKQLLKRKKLYIRALGKPSPDGHTIYLYLRLCFKQKDSTYAIDRRATRHLQP